MGYSWFFFFFLTNRCEHMAVQQFLGECIRFAAHTQAVCRVCLTCSSAGLRQWTAELISRISLLRNSGCGWCQESCWILENPTFYQINLGLRQMLAYPGVRKGKELHIVTLSYIYFFKFSSSSTGFVVVTRTISCHPLDLQLDFVPHTQGYISVLSCSINSSSLVLFSAWQKTFSFLSSLHSLSTRPPFNACSIPVGIQNTVKLLSVVCKQQK